MDGASASSPYLGVDVGPWPDALTLLIDLFIGTTWYVCVDNNVFVAERVLCIASDRCCQGRIHEFEKETQLSHP